MNKQTAPSPVDVRPLDGGKWSLTFHLTDGPHIRIANDEAHARQIAERVLPGMPIRWERTWR